MTGVEFPLSPQQEFLWEGARFRSLGQPLASRGNPSIALELSGRWEPDRFRSALDLMIARHEPLRTTLTDLGEAPRQKVGPAIEAPLSFVDLSTTTAPERREALARALVAGARATEFDLVDGPLWTCLLVRLSATRHVLAFAFSHLIIDGVSLLAFLRQLEDLYSGRELPPLKRQYRHFVEESAAPLPDLEQRLEHWRRVLSPLPGRLSFPTDYSATPPALISYAEEDFKSRSTTAELREIGRRHRATPFTLNVAAYALVLGRTSGEPKVVIGSSVARLDLKPDEDSLGYFLDNIFVPVLVRPRQPVADLVAQVRQSLLDAQRFTVPYRALAEAVNPDFAEQRPWPGIHLYDAWVRGRVFEATSSGTTASFGRTAVTLFSAPGGSAPREVVEPAHQAAYTRYYLPSLYLNDAAGSNGYLEYNRAVFARDTARRIAADQQHVVARLADASAPVEETWQAVRRRENGKA
ncbi:condensation domain-containing protein [Amycolatopsis sp. cmx-4-83]|uniref:condensation domain-containing protein n=1 Tax=Amycolatopsis sp. cmx-4-83 TaxID=2790940 RepID=UPI0039790D5C